MMTHRVVLIPYCHCTFLTLILRNQRYLVASKPYLENPLNNPVLVSKLPKDIASLREHLPSEASYETVPPWQVSPA